MIYNNIHRISYPWAQYSLTVWPKTLFISFCLSVLASRNTREKREREREREGERERENYNDNVLSTGLTLSLVPLGVSQPILCHCHITYLLGGYFSWGVFHTHKINVTIMYQALFFAYIKCGEETLFLGRMKIQMDFLLCDLLF